MKLSNELLSKINKQLSSENVEHRTRPWKAMELLSTQEGISIAIPSQEADFLFKWFESNGKPSAQKQGHYHQGTYLFDSEFWSVSIPLIYGSVKINSLDALHEMPKSIKDSLIANKKRLSDYVIYWADCIDFGMGYGDLRDDKNLDPFGVDLLNAGYEELSSATSLMLEHRLNTRAILNCRMATEMFLKSFISLKISLSDKEARKAGHNLNTLMDKFIECSGYKHLEKIKPGLSVFPEVNERYKEQKIDRKQLFEAYCFAQSIGVLIIREFTDRNTLTQVLAFNKPQ
jgi:hypothetical protein